MIGTCHKCSFRQRPCAGPCECRAEPDKPVDIIERAKSGVCPRGFFTAPAMRPPERIDAAFDPEAEKRRLQQGGCCGKPSLNDPIPPLVFPTPGKAV